MEQNRSKEETGPTMNKTPLYEAIQGVPNHLVIILCYCIRITGTSSCGLIFNKKITSAD